MSEVSKAHDGKARVSYEVKWRDIHVQQKDSSERWLAKVNLKGSKSVPCTIRTIEQHLGTSSRKRTVVNESVLHDLHMIGRHPRMMYVRVARFVPFFVF